MAAKRRKRRKTKDEALVRTALPAHLAGESNPTSRSSPILLFLCLLRIFAAMPIAVFRLKSRRSWRDLRATVLGEKLCRSERTAKPRLPRAAASAPIPPFRKSEYVNQTNNRFAASVAVRHKTGNFDSLDTIRGTPTSGVPESVPVKAYQCLCRGVSRSRLFSFWTGGRIRARPPKTKVALGVHP